MEKMPKNLRQQDEKTRKMIESQGELFEGE